MIHFCYSDASRYSHRKFYYSTQKEQFSKKQKFSFQIPAFLADMFGPTNIGACHGLILTAWSIAGVGGGLTFTAIYNQQIALGWTIEDAYPYIINSHWMLVFIVAGLISGIFVRTTLKDRLLPPVDGQWFRFRIFGKIVRIKKVTLCPEVEILSSKEYDDEWEKYLQTRNVPSKEVS